MVVRAEPVDESINEELADAVATRDGTTILIECKGTFIRSADKYSGVPRRFMRGLSQKFGRAKHGGVYQLARGISRVWFDQVARSPIARPETVTDVFPVLVVQDPILGCGPVTRVLSDRFQTAIQRAARRVNHKTPKIWPLTVMMADDLDRLSAAVQVTGGRRAQRRFSREWPDLARVPVSDPLVSRAGTLAWDYNLRGYDAVQLASALTWQEAIGQDVCLGTFDKQLWEAAWGAGLHVWPEKLVSANC